MTRPTRMSFDPTALLHNLNHVRRLAPQQKIIAVVKANAYGCGLNNVIPILEGHVDVFGVAALSEALAIRKLGSTTPCLLLQGVFSPEEWAIAATTNIHCVIHQFQQLTWLLSSSYLLNSPVTVWIKINTGMNRLGFAPQEVAQVLEVLRGCAWVSPNIGLMTHFACADEIGDPRNILQVETFERHAKAANDLIQSLANSAVILSMPNALGDVVRPGIMLYGVSPFAHQSGKALGLRPVTQFLSAITTIHRYPPNAQIGYSGAWHSEKSSVIGVIPVGYADGYPRHIASGTPVWVDGTIVPIVGRISMDMLTVDLTHCDSVEIGTSVELWGKHIPIETIAASAETIAYELLTKVTSRARSPMDRFET